MDVRGHLDFKGVGKLLRPSLAASDFPPDPSVGEIIFKDKKIFVCVEIATGLPFWVCLTPALTLHRHDQAVPALEWSIAHSLNTNYVNVQVYDAEGYQVIPENIHCAENLVTVSFGAPTIGVAILVYGDALGMPRTNYAYTNTYEASTTWVVQHNLGYNPNITCIVDDYVVQPLSIQHNTINQATVSFSSPVAGSVRCV